MLCPLLSSYHRWTCASWQPRRQQLLALQDSTQALCQDSHLHHSQVQTLHVAQWLAAPLLSLQMMLDASLHVGLVGGDEEQSALAVGRLVPGTAKSIPVTQCMPKSSSCQIGFTRSALCMCLVQGAMHQVQPQHHPWASVWARLRS
jgi:hypothetical protein